MSTRATYQIKSGFSAATVYIHHDGYPSGAADYFMKAEFLQEKTDRSFLNCFLWANKGAEITESHEVHGDTEYRYNLYRSNNIWRIEALKRPNYASDQFEVFFTGKLGEFYFNHMADTPLVMDSGVKW